LTRVLHILPHRGGGAEKYIDLLELLEGYEPERLALSATRRPLAAIGSIAARLPTAARRAAQADLVHAHGDVAAMLSLPLLRRRPSVVTTHGLHFLRRARGPRRWAAERGLRAVTATARCTVCTSEAERDELRALAGGRAQRLVVVANGITIPAPADAQEREVARAELGLAPDAVAVLYLGQLERRKDPLTAARAAARAREVNPSLVLLVAGEGPLEAEIAGLAGGGIRMLGFRRDTRSLLVAADIFVLPSSREGLSLSVLEAMAHGLAVVVSDGAGNPEAVGGAGIVCPFGDERAFAAALVRLTENQAERDALGAAARARVTAGFSAERFAGDIDAVYAAVLADSPPFADRS
jgi:glycosyltransferase involved in cell wall biosynthesis